jgi:hypothetical protein
VAGPIFASMPGLPDRADPPRPVPALPGSRIQLILQAVPHRNQPGDASCRKSPPHASPNLAPPTQPNENTHLKTSLLKLPHTPTRCVTQAGGLTALRRNRLPDLFFAGWYASEPPQYPRVRATHCRNVLACGIATLVRFHYPQD